MTVIDKKHGVAIVKAIVKASFVVKKGFDNEGKRIITMRKLCGIIKKAYKDEFQNKDLPLEFIHDIINQLVSLKYLCFKKYESGALVFYPTKKCKEIK